jgi:RNA polymerase sigma-70 factor (ECF subfamily)
VVDEELVRRAQRGDRDAFDILMSSAIDRLVGIARVILRDLDAAEEAVQDALVRCWQDLPGLRAPDRFEAWLHRILLNVVMDASRRRGRHAARFTVLRWQPVAPDSTGVVADREALAQAFGRLSVEHRTAIVTHFYLGLSTEESAAMLGIPAGTAKSRLHYATSALRAALDADARDESIAKALA